MGKRHRGSSRKYVAETMKGGENINVIDTPTDMNIGEQDAGGLAKLAAKGAFGAAKLGVKGATTAFKYAPKSIKGDLAKGVLKGVAKTAFSMTPVGQAYNVAKLGLNVAGKTTIGKKLGSKATGLAGTLKSKSSSLLKKGTPGTPGSAPRQPGAAPAANPYPEEQGGMSEADLSLQKAQLARQSSEADIKNRQLQRQERRDESDMVRNDAMVAKETISRRLIWLNWFRKIVATITEPIRRLFVALFHSSFPLAHYITLLVVFLFIAGSIGFFMYGSPSIKCCTNWFQKLMNKTFGFRTRRIFQKVGGVTQVTIPRPIIPGRCDNVYYYEKASGKGGLCTSTIKPTDITWNINTEKNDDLLNLPSAVIDKLSNNSQKFVVKIPWVIDKSGMQFIPDCNKATYLDGTSADLLVDKGDICEKNVKSREDYTGSYRPNPELSTYEGLDAFATENNPMCN